MRAKRTILRRQASSRSISANNKKQEKARKPLTEEVRRKNRASVQRCRARKREKRASLEKEIESYAVENARLHECIMKSLESLEDVEEAFKADDTDIDSSLGENVRKLLDDVRALAKKKK